MQPNGAATGNNYYRSEGQNVGNFMTDRPSSRVLAPPGGGSQISFGYESAPSTQVCNTVRPSVLHAFLTLYHKLCTEMSMSCLQVQAQGQGQADKGTSLFMGGKSPNGGSNNYSRPSGQNVGNFLTERNSSRVLAPPGGASQISFG